MSKNAIAQNQNLIKSSRDITVASWITDGTSTAATVSGVDHLGNTSTFSRLTCAGGGLQYIRGNGYTPAANPGMYTFSAWVKTVAGGSQNFRLKTAGTYSGNLAVTGTWSQAYFTSTEPASASTCIIANDASGNALDIYIDDIQIVRANWVGPRVVTTGSIVDTGDIANIISAKNSIVQLQNLFIYSQQLDATCSTVGASIGTNTTDTLDPWGTNTAEVLIEDGSAGTHRIQNLGGTPSVVGRIQTLSVYVKAGTRSRVYIQNSVTESITVNLTTGAIVASVGGIARGVINAGNGWWRIWIAFVSAATSASLYVYADNGSTVSYTGTNAAKALYVTGAQYVRASWPGTYVQTGASAVNTGDIANAIPTAQNLFVNSDDQAGASYTKEGVTCPVDATVADPWGGMGMSAMTEDATNAVHRISHATTFTAAEVGKIVTISAWIKKGTENVAVFSVAGLAPTDFDVNAGTVSAGSGVLRATIRLDANGVYRCENTFLVTSAMVGYKAFISARQSAIYQGTNGNKALYIKGMQKSYANRAGDRALTTAAVYNVGDISNDVI